jgi:very-short-patch-repair endonuclease
MPSKKSDIIHLARELRKNQTEAEGILWSVLRNRKLNGRKFTRQHPVYYGYSICEYDFFIVDFCCTQRMLVIELDGEIHEFQKEYDQERTAILMGMGYRVLRIKNTELADIESVKNKICAML